jgi:uncharacterized protein YcbK (DUF882 family)
MSDIRWKKGETLKLSKYFTSKEFENSTDTEFMLDPELIVLLDLIREEFGKPIRITSGYRSPAHNAKVGGSPRSQHMLGKAADITPGQFSSSELDRLYAICEKHSLAVGDGRKRGFIHIDTRKDAKRRFSY